MLETDNSKKSDKNDRKVPLILSYLNSLPNIKAILEKNERIFNNDTEIKNKMVNKTFLGLKRNKNFKDLLVHRKKKYILQIKTKKVP